SMAKLRPSMKPISASPLRTLASINSDPCSVASRRNPITGIGRPRAAIGHATAPPTPAANCRRVTVGVIVPPSSSQGPEHYQDFEVNGISCNAQFRRDRMTASGLERRSQGFDPSDLGFRNTSESRHYFTNERFGRCVHIATMAATAKWWGADSLDSLVGDRKQCRRHRQAECFRGLEIDYQLELGRSHNRQIACLLPVENPPRVDAYLFVDC